MGRSADIVEFDIETPDTAFDDDILGVDNVEFFTLPASAVVDDAQASSDPVKRDDAKPAGRSTRSERTADSRKSHPDRGRWIAVGVLALVLTAVSVVVLSDDRTAKPVVTSPPASTPAPTVATASVATPRTRPSVTPARKKRRKHATPKKRRKQRKAAKKSRPKTPSAPAPVATAPAPSAPQAPQSSGAGEFSVERWAK